MAGAGDLEEDLVLPLELDLLVVDATRQEHRPVGGDELVLREAVRGAAGLGGGGHWSRGWGAAGNLQRGARSEREGEGERGEIRDKR